MFKPGDLITYRKNVLDYSEYQNDYLAIIVGTIENYYKIKWIKNPNERIKEFNYLKYSIQLEYKFKKIKS